VHADGRIHDRVGSMYEYQGFGCVEQQVLVPVEVFAKEPAAWEKAWVNLFFRSRPGDQCDFRKRRLFAYTIQPILGVSRSLWFLLFGFVGLLFACKPSKFPWGGVLHPFRRSLEEALNFMDLPETSWAWRTHSWKKTLALTLLMTPVGWAVTGGVVVTAMTISLATFWTSFVLPALIIFSVAGGGLVGRLLVAHLAPWLNERKATHTRQALVCGSNKKASKPIRLYFHDIKAKVCRPFSR